MTAIEQTNKALLEEECTLQYIFNTRYHKNLGVCYNEEKDDVFEVCRVFLK